MSIKKIWSLFLVGLFQSEARQNYFAAFYGQICCGTLEPVAVEQGEASTSIVEVATVSAGVERIQGRKKLEYKR